MAEFDSLILGSGMAGLSVAALLARDGERVKVLEAHEYPGGYAHTFPMGKWSFCAQVHYVFGCGEGETIGLLLEALGLEKTVQFVRLDPEGFDQVVIAGERYRIPNGLEKCRVRLTHRFPREAKGLRDYFSLLAKVAGELASVPDKRQLSDWLTAPIRFSHVLRHRNHTLQDVYGQLGLSPRLQAVLAGQAGDYLLPPGRVAFLLHAALVSGYDSGAYYPRKHFKYFVDQIVGTITARPGCEVLLNQRVERIEVREGRVAGVRTADGVLHTAKRYISNIDPGRTVELTGRENFPARYLNHVKREYSCGSFTMYLGTKDIDLRGYGFGSFNTWHYPHEDINAIYERQVVRNDLSDPWLFMSTPTLHTDEPGLAPPGGQVLCIATSCAYEPFRDLRASDVSAYRRLKHANKERILDILEANYIPGLRKHLAIQVVGTSATNERYCLAPQGNAYGIALTPENTTSRISMSTPLDNLWLCNASAGWPSVAGTVGSGIKLHQLLTGKAI
ncbi:MAG: NAD(P)/FAD-dependent oxidoreductase [Deltaproteobacteria bacterium]|nr:NAD(P)/FAD-dependent oxidoreductase [Deltaproteobacteria bacterium]